MVRAPGRVLPQGLLHQEHGGQGPGWDPQPGPDLPTSLFESLVKYLLTLRLHSNVHLALFTKHCGLLPEG